MEAFSGALATGALASCQTLNLGFNKIGDGGMEAFSGALATGAMPQLLCAGGGKIEGWCEHHSEQHMGVVLGEPVVNKHTLAMCIVVACIAVRLFRRWNHFFTVIFTPAPGVHTWV